MSVERKRGPHRRDVFPPTHQVVRFPRTSFPPLCGKSSGLAMFKLHTQRKARRAFTKIELVVAFGVFLILSSMLLPLVRGILDRGQQISCQSNLRQLGAAYHLFAIEHREKFPGHMGSSEAVDDPAEISSIGTYGWLNAPLALLRAGYIPNLDVFYCPSQRLYTHPDSSTATGQQGWARQGYFVGYVYFTLRDFNANGTPNPWGNLRNATLRDHPGVPLVMDFFPGFLTVQQALHGAHIHVLRVDGSVNPEEWEYMRALGSWRQRVEYLARIHTGGES